jgi:hypothetical protein
VGAAPPPRVLLAVGTPDVKGASETDEAPLKAGEPAEAEGSAMEALAGFKTLEDLLVKSSMKGIMILLTCR